LRHDFDGLNALTIGATKMDNNTNNVFISYRRKNSRHAALLVYKDLKSYGYDVFIDYESIDNGKFGQIILNQIASRRHFVLILAPGCLDRAVNPDDWLRMEIVYALEMQRNIVPLLFDGFEFEPAKQYLTGKLSELICHNALIVPDGYFDEAMNKVRNRFLQQPVKGIVTPAPESDSLFVQEVIQKANKAAEDENAQVKVHKLTDKNLLRQPTSTNKVMSKIYVGGREISPVPATFELLGRLPVMGEIIYMNEGAGKDISLNEKHGGKLIITDKRLIFWDLVREVSQRDYSFEISMTDLANARFRSIQVLTLINWVEIQMRDGKIYSLCIDKEQKNLVESLINLLSSKPR